MSTEQHPEEIPLLSTEERSHTAGTSVDHDPAAASATRQRTFKDALVSGPSDSHEGTGDKVADRGQALRRKGGEFAAQAEQDVRGVVNIAQKGVASGTWFYPIRGVVYLLTRESLPSPLPS